MYPRSLLMAFTRKIPQYLYVFLVGCLFTTFASTIGFETRDLSPVEGVQCKSEFIPKKRIIEEGQVACEKLSKASESLVAFPIVYEGRLFGRTTHPLFAYPVSSLKIYKSGRGGPNRIIYDQQCNFHGVVREGTDRQFTICEPKGTPITENFTTLKSVVEPGYRCGNVFFTEKSLEKVAKDACVKLKTYIPSPSSRKPRPFDFLWENFGTSSVILWRIRKYDKSSIKGGLGPFRIVMEENCNLISVVSVLRGNYSKCVFIQAAAPSAMKK